MSVRTPLQTPGRYLNAHFANVFPIFSECYTVIYGTGIRNDARRASGGIRPLFVTAIAFVSCRALLTWKECFMQI
ncbi:Hypothetical predicted protein [Cloeon dipterum]|uniref:Uncharacterized protein n=1 Tax=Cloeon dipterum TaxID=197152 RepID=A0A8S1CCJ0_9INSE|nr:Hypothetical predicted protein [Cloeon dipterum]